jgi:hypothetical protein
MRHSNLGQGKTGPIEHGEKRTLEPEYRHDVEKIRIWLVQANNGFVWAASDHHNPIGMFRGV